MPVEIVLGLVRYICEASNEDNGEETCTVSETGISSRDENDC